MPVEPATSLAIVTGSSSGIGVVVAERLQDEGYFVLGGALELPSSSPANPARRSDLWLDVRSPSAVESFFAHADALGHSLALLVHCAGVGLHRSLEHTDEAAWTEVIDVNLGGTYRVCRAAIARMRARGGRIINIGSVADHEILANNAAYSASKHGVRALTGTINKEHAHERIRATLVSLGAVATPLWGSEPAFHFDDMLRPHDVAEAIVAIARMPLHVRVDAIELLPAKGVL